MKSQQFKKIVVSILSKPYVVEVDSDIFDCSLPEGGGKSLSDFSSDVYLEAATRVIEQYRKKKNFQIAVVVECYEDKDLKVPDRHYIYNSYFLLVNAGMHEKAEHLRESFKHQFGIDLQKESIRGESGKQPIDPGDGKHSANQ